MTNRTRKVAAFLTFALLGLAVLNFATAPQKAYALDLGGTLGNLIKIGGIALIVQQFDDQINDGINNILQKNGVMPEAKTRVVPIVRLGLNDPAAVGAAQIVGPPSQVDKVRAVGQGSIRIGGLQGRILIPITTKKSQTSTVKGVGGVGVSATIKIKL